MIISIQNLGVVRSCEFNFSKKLSVFCGKNNTGKTYVSYAVYSLTKTSLSLFRNIWLEDAESDLLESESYTLNIDISKVISAIQNCLSNVKLSLDSVFGISERDAEKLFNSTRFKINDYHEMEKKISCMEIDITVEIEEIIFRIKKEKQSLLVNFSSDQAIVSKLSEDSKRYISFAIQLRVREMIFERLISAAVIFPVERIAIPTFKTELSINRNVLIDHMLDMSQKKPKSNSEFMLYKALRDGSKRYPESIRYALGTAHDLAEIQKNKSKYYDIAVELEKELLDGIISSDRNGDVIFVHNKGSKANKLPVHMTASVVKSFANIIFYFKHLAKENELVIIDEPEMNLHPDGQVAFVHLMVKMIMNGLKFLISTHSDYIVREINNIVLSSKCNEFENKSLDNYHLSEEDVEFYYFDYKTKIKVDAKNIPFERYGYEINSINEVIDKQNKVYEDLIFNSMPSDD